MTYRMLLSFRIAGCSWCTYINSTFRYLHRLCAHASITAQPEHSHLRRFMAVIRDHLHHGKYVCSMLLLKAFHAYAYMGDSMAWACDRNW